jgi:uncharacterized protein (DUF1330 family)
MLSVRGLETFYGVSQVLFGLTLDVAQGEVVTLLGRNGMGKTTTINSIMGIVRPRTGSIRFDGQEVTRLPSFRIAKLGLGLVPEGRQVFPNLTVFENLVATAAGLAGHLARTRRPRGYPAPLSRGLTDSVVAMARQRGTTMKGYWIAQVTVTDPDQYRLYAESAPEAFASTTPAILARGGRCAQLEGEGRPRNVVIEFDSFEDALACYNSPEYQAAKAKREGAGEAAIVIVEGV